MKRRLVAASLAGLVAATPALSHYGMIIPNDPMISQEDGRSVDLTMSLSHPFELDGMMLDTPVAFSVTPQGSTTNLLGGMQDATVMDDQGYTLEYQLARPGTCR